MAVAAAASKAPPTPGGDEAGAHLLPAAAPAAVPLACARTSREGGGGGGAAASGSLSPRNEGPGGIVAAREGGVRRGQRQPRARVGGARCARGRSLFLLSVLALCRPLFSADRSRCGRDVGSGSLVTRWLHDPIRGRALSARPAARGQGGATVGRGESLFRTQAETETGCRALSAFRLSLLRVDLLVVCLRVCARAIHWRWSEP